MKVVSEDFVKGKKVLLRMDIDVPLRKMEDGRWKVEEDFRLKACLPTLDLCIENAKSVVVMGHLGRPGGRVIEELSVAPIVEWLESQPIEHDLEDGRLHVLENLRFESGESFDTAQDKDVVFEFAKELAKMGDVFVNESFAAYRSAASTTILPTLMPHAAGLQFAKEVGLLTQARNNPKHPLVAIIGGAKVEDKYKSIVALSKFCDAVLVGGLLPKEIQEKRLVIDRNVMLGKIAENGIDLSSESVDAFIALIKNAKQIIWGGPVGKYETEEGILGTAKLADAILKSDAKTIVGGGDIVAAINKLGKLDDFLKKGLVSTGGGAMLNLLEKGTLPTIEALN